MPPGPRYPLLILMALLAGYGAAGLSSDDAPVSTEARSVQTTSATPTTRGPREPVRQASRSAASGPSETDLQALRDEVAAAELHLALLQGQREAVEGVPQPWTDDLPAADRPEAVEAAVVAAIEAHGEGELLDMDCDEYPCLLAVEFPPSDDGSSAVSWEFLRTLQDSWDHPHTASTAATGRSEDGEHTFLVMAFYDKPDETPEGLATRVEVRRDRLSDRLRHELSEAP